MAGPLSLDTRAELAGLTGPNGQAVGVGLVRNPGTPGALNDPSSWSERSLLITAGADTPASTVYWPWVIRTDRIANPLGRYYMYYTTDHDARAGASFMESNAIRAQQDYLFSDVVWSGSWGKGFHLTGTNNNSEFRFRDCAAVGFSRGPFIDSIDSDQFVNYWLFGFKWWGAKQPIARMTRGGHVRAFAIDASDFGSNLGVSGAPTEAFLFELLGNTHARGVCHLSVDGLRVEAKHAQAKLLRSEWPHGVVAFRGVDYTSQMPWNTYGDIIDIDVGNVDGAIYSFRDSDLAGGVRVRYNTNAPTRKQLIVFDACTMYQRAQLQDVVAYSGPAGMSYQPPVAFDHCRAMIA